MSERTRQNRNRQLVVNIEDSFYNHFQVLCGKQDITASSLMRRLIIKHLIETGVVPESVVLNSLL